MAKGNNAQKNNKKDKKPKKDAKKAPEKTSKTSQWPVGESNSYYQIESLVS